MDETVFKNAVAAVSTGDYTDKDIEILREKISFLNKKELALKRQMEKKKNEFVREKDKSGSELRKIRKEIKDLKNILKTF